MRICITQTRPIAGDLQSNIQAHVKLIEEASKHQVTFIFFPELSLSAYEPKLAAKLAVEPYDTRLDVFQDLSTLHGLTIALGVPTTIDTGVCISMIIFQPQRSRRVYSKKYLHADEEAYFVSAEHFPVFEIQQQNLAPAICYEISIDAHAEAAYLNGAKIYFASVAKSKQGVEAASARMAQIAKKYKMLVLLSNSVGPCDDFVAAGNSSIWNEEGDLLAKLDGENEGLLIIDTVSRVVLS